jgi:hypothetical protein
MKGIVNLLQPSKLKDVDSPMVFDLSFAEHEEMVRNLFLKAPNLTIYDQYLDQLLELFTSRHPELKLMPERKEEFWMEFLAAREERSELKLQGRWVYFSWKNVFCHLLEPEEFFELRLSRNRNLITSEEQGVFSKSIIGITGLSVGSSVAKALALSGFRHFRLADHDVLGLSNMNRICASVVDIGKGKTRIAAEQFWEIDPFTAIEEFANGIMNEETAIQFLKTSNPLSVLVDEMDDVVMKIKIRKLARAMRIPVVSAADNGDNVIVDVERFDEEEDRPLFHGRIPYLDSLDLNHLSFPERFRLINDMVGVEIVTESMKASLKEVGRTLYTWPQLGSTAMIAGAAVAQAVRRILLKHPFPSDKYQVNMERIFTPNYDEASAKDHREKVTEEFLTWQKILSP